MIVAWIVLRLIRRTLVNRTLVNRTLVIRTLVSLTLIGVAWILSNTRSGFDLRLRIAERQRQHCQ